MHAPGIITVLWHAILSGLAPLLMQPTDCITENMHSAGPSDALLTAANPDGRAEL